MTDLDGPPTAAGTSAVAPHADPTVPAAPTPGPRPRNRRGRNVGVALAVAVVLAAGVTAARRANASAPHRYRTATVGLHDVDQVLTSVGEIEPVSQVSVAFPTSGTVATVPVAVGDTVGVGQTLATLSTTSLTTQLHTQEQALADATLHLAQLSNARVSANAATARTSTTTASNDELADLLDATTAATDAQQRAQATLQAAAHACGVTTLPAAVTPSSPRTADTPHGRADSGDGQATGTSSEPTTTTTAGPAPDETASSTAVPTTTATGGPRAGGDTTDSACTGALEQAVAAQAEASNRQRALADATDAYTRQRDEGTSPSNSTGRTGGAASGATSGSSGASDYSGASGPSGASGMSNTGADGGSTTAASAADLVAAQRSVDAASDAVAVAQQALAQATIVSPIAGTVAEIGFTPGDQVSAASTTSRVLVVAPGGYEVTTFVPVADLAKVKLGQAAQVLPDGAGHARGGTVTQIGITPTDGTTGATYPVTIGFTGDTTGLLDGGTAQVTIVTLSATRALAVPTSAITTTGTRHTVTVLHDDTPRTVAVEVGAIGPTWTQLTGGVAQGTTVVLADLDAPLPDAATTNAQRTRSGSTEVRQGEFLEGAPGAGFSRPGG